MVAAKMTLGFMVLSVGIIKCQAADEESRLSSSPLATEIKLTFVDEKDELCTEIPFKDGQQDTNPLPDYPIFHVEYEVQKFCDIPDFSLIKEHLDVYSQQQRADRCCVVLDVDGTLTNEQDPTVLDKPTAVTPRSESGQFIAWLDSNAFKRTYSSAWHIVPHTLMRLETLDLPIGGESLNVGVLQIAGESFGYYQKGMMCSVRHQNFTYSNPYFRYKVFSPIPVCTDWQELEVLALVEDSEVNANAFVKHLEVYNPYPNLNKVLIFCLSKPEKLAKSSSSSGGD